MAADNSIRVVVKINPNRHPELFDAINDIESSGRAERMRALALMALSGYAASGGPADIDEPKKRRSTAKPKSSDATSADSRDADGSSAKRTETIEKPDLEEKVEDDPHKAVRASVLSGLKNAGF